MTEAHKLAIKALITAYKKHVPEADYDHHLISVVERMIGGAA